jgi:hypothetical protein
MKKILFTLLIGSSLTAWSQCETGVVTNDTTICIGDTVTITAFGPGTPLTTTFVGGNNHRGNMFDIVALSTVTIESFDGQPMGNTDCEIYYKIGTYLGFETNAAAWTLVGSATNVIAQPMGTPTAIPISVVVTIPAGQTYSFYVTSNNIAVSQNYTDGSVPGTVFASDANIQFLGSAGMEYPFGTGGSVFSPRVWNGIINYSIETTYLWDSDATASQIVETRTVQTKYLVDIIPNECPSSTDSVTIYINPAPVLDLGADTSICPCIQITLDTGAGFSVYLWSTAETNQSITADGATLGVGVHSFTVEVTNIFGCTNMDTLVVNVDGCLGLIRLKVKHMQVYPNPTADLLHIEFDMFTSEPLLNVYSMEGSLVLSERMTSQYQSLDLNRLERGSYILELSTDDYKEIIKVIKNG